MLRGGGSHRKWHNPATGRATIVPDWGGRDLKIGTIRGAVKQLGIDWAAFEVLPYGGLFRHFSLNATGDLTGIWRIWRESKGFSPATRAKRRLSSDQ